MVNVWELATIPFLLGAACGFMVALFLAFSYAVGVERELKDNLGHMQKTLDWITLKWTAGTGGPNVKDR